MSSIRLVSLILCLLLLVVCNPNACQAAGTPLELLEIGTLTLPTGFDIKPAQDDTSAPGIEAQYDLSFLSPDDTWHYARLIIFKDKNDMGLAAGIFNQGIQNPQILKMLSDKVKDMLEKSITEKGAHLLQWYPAKSAIAGKRNAVNLAFRCTATDKLPMPLYLTVYCFIPDRQVTGLAILCADSDRKYWEPVFKEAVVELK